MPGKFENVLLACDVDGTIYNGKVGTVPTRNIEAVAYFKENGGLFTLATGRSVPNARFLFPELFPSAPCVMANGTLLYDYQKEQVCAAVNLPKEAWDVACRVMEAFPETAIKVMAGEEVFYYNTTPFCQWVQDTFGIGGPERAFAPFPENTNKILFCNPREESQKLVAFCKETWPQHESLEMVSSSPYLYEVLPKGANKATGVEMLMNLLSIPEDRVFVMGDYYNDEPMLRRFAHSFAPAGAPEDLKALCERSFGPCEDGAVADLIEYLDQMF